MPPVRRANLVRRAKCPFTPKYAFFQREVDFRVTLGPSWVGVGSILGRFGPIWVEVGRFGVSVGGRSGVKFGPIWSRCGSRLRVAFGPSDGSTWGRSGGNLGRFWNRCGGAIHGQGWADVESVCGVDPGSMWVEAASLENQGWAELGSVCGVDPGASVGRVLSRRGGGVGGGARLGPSWGQIRGRPGVALGSMFGDLQRQG